MKLTGGKRDEVGDYNWKQYYRDLAMAKEGEKIKDPDPIKFALPKEYELLSDQMKKGIMIN